MNSEHLQLIPNADFYLRKICKKDGWLYCHGKLFRLFYLYFSHDSMLLKCECNFYESFKTGDLLFNTCYINIKYTVLI